MSGAFALYPLAIKWKDEYQKLHPEVRIDVQAGGAGKGMADALAGQVSLGMVSRDINEEEIKQGAWYVPVTKDAVIPTMNPDNPYYTALVTKGIKRETFVDLWINEKPLTWGEIVGKEAKDAVKVYKRSDAAGAAESWAKYLGKKQDNLKGTGVFGDPGLASAVKKDVYGIGFNNVIYVFDPSTKKPFEGLRAIPIDINENGQVDSTENFYDNIEAVNAAIADGRYPSPPARELYFVSKGKPQNKVILDFLKWVLTDGQKYVKEAGFINLSEEKIKEAQDKLGK
jgi:phosphate transport system substrate-binding protein